MRHPKRMTDGERLCSCPLPFSRLFRRQSCPFSVFMPLRVSMGNVHISVLCLVIVKVAWSQFVFALNLPEGN